MLPIFFENSRIPKLLSKIAPFKVGGFAFLIFVWCRGTASLELRTHETTHYKQQLEMLFIAQWILYGLFWVILLFWHGDAYLAYRMSPFEIEAYDNQSDATYNTHIRRPYAWIKCVPKSFERIKDA